MSGLISVGNKKDGNITVFEVDEEVDDTIEIYDEIKNVPATIVEQIKQKENKQGNKKEHKKENKQENKQEDVQAKYKKLLNLFGTHRQLILSKQTENKPVNIVKNNKTSKAKKKTEDYSFFDTGKAQIKIYEEQNNHCDNDDQDEQDEQEIDELEQYRLPENQQSQVNNTSNKSNSSTTNINQMVKKIKPKSYKLDLSFKVKPVVELYSPDTLFEFYADLLINRFGEIVKCAENPEYTIDIPDLGKGVWFPKKINIVNNPIYPIAICKNDECYGRCNFLHIGKNQCGVHNYKHEYPISSNDLCTNDLCTNIINNGCTRNHTFGTACMSIIIRGIMFAQSPDPANHNMDKRLLYQTLKNIENIRIGKEPLRIRIRALP